jgi:hypothetical protein
MPNPVTKALRLGFGKVRRFYLHTFRKKYIEKQLKERLGECGRCAACCKLLFKCPFLDESGPIAMCSIHDRRPDNCRFFPIDPRDLADRDFVDPANPCGFYFPGQPPPHPTGAGHPVRAGHPAQGAGIDRGRPLHAKSAMGDDEIEVV